MRISRGFHLPMEIIVDSKTVDIKVKIVNSFKLSGVTIDNKLIFSEHCSNI